MFIDKEQSPTTCCCGCTLTCGIITLFVLQAIGLVASIVELNTGMILFGLANTVPLACLYYYNGCAPVRHWNFLQQIVNLLILIGYLVYGFIIAHNIITLACQDHDGPLHFSNGSVVYT